VTIRGAETGGKLRKKEGEGSSGSEPAGKPYREHGGNKRPVSETWGKGKKTRSKTFFGVQSSRAARCREYNGCPGTI